MPPPRFDASRLRTGALSALLLLIVSSLAPGTASAAAPSLRIRLVLSGGYSYSGTLAHTEGQPQVNGCSVNLGGGNKKYNLTYNGLELFALMNGKVKHDSFLLAANRYTRGARYASSASTSVSLVVIVHKRAYSNFSGAASAVAVRITKNGLSGTITVPRLSSYPGFPGGSVRLQATWSCDALR